MYNKKIISTDKAPRAIGTYSQAIKVNNLLFTSGQIPLSPISGEVISDNFSDQVEQCLKNLQGILEEEGLTLNCVIKLNVRNTISKAVR